MCEPTCMYMKGKFLWYLEPANFLARNTGTFFCTLLSISVNIWGKSDKYMCMKYQSRISATLAVVYINSIPCHDSPCTLSHCHVGLHVLWEANIKWITRSSFFTLPVHFCEMYFRNAFLQYQYIFVKCISEMNPMEGLYMHKQLTTNIMYLSTC